jgi:hypothetical protein
MISGPSKTADIEMNVVTGVPLFGVGVRKYWRPPTAVPLDRAIVGCPQRCQHFEKVIERIVLAGNDTARFFGARKFCQHFSDVIGHSAIFDLRATKNMSNEDVKIKPRGNAQASAPFKQRVKESVVIQNQIAGFFVGKELDETIGGFDFVPQDGKDEINVFGRELDPAVRLNDIHHTS